MSEQQVMQDILDLCLDIQGVDERTYRTVLLNLLGRSAVNMLQLRIKVIDLINDKIRYTAKIRELERELEKETTDVDVVTF